MQKQSFTPVSRSGVPGGASRVRRRALLGGAVLLVLLALAGLLAFLTRDARTTTANIPAAQASQASPSTAATTIPSATAGRGSLPAVPTTHDPIAFGKAAVAALWSYDTRAYTQPELVAALHTWITGDSQYADASSVDAQVPSPASRAPLGGVGLRLFVCGQIRQRRISSTHASGSIGEAPRTQAACSGSVRTCR
ncbi:hypothetical protein [Kitasatospora acidiphila]|uniref:hypothetical protein n=1 Tax=Kitasatospora acidiphila TaxID=2567942 RepID=UPI003C77ECBF